MEALGRADNMNQLLFSEIAKLIYNDMPGGGTCHGSYKIYDEWITKHQERRDLEAKNRKEAEE